MKIKNLLAYIFIGTISLFSSCVKEDMDDCNYNIRFKYTWNMLNSEAFMEQVDEVELYVYDKEGKYIKTLYDQGSHIQKANYTLKVKDLPFDEYSFIAVGRNNRYTGAMSDLQIPTFIPKESTLRQFFAKLNKNQTSNTFEAPLNNFLMGTATVDGRPGENYVTISTRKVNKDIRIVLVDEQERALTTSDFTIELAEENSSGAIGHDFTLQKAGKLKYLPYLYEKVIPRKDPNTTPPNEYLNAVAAEFSLLRLVEDNKINLTVKDNAGNLVLVYDLLDWLHLLKVEGHVPDNMSFQEYLDREDKFSISLFVSVDNSTWLSTKIIINGWVINLIDIDF